jgi:hypothetical protein
MQHEINTAYRADIPGSSCCSFLSLGISLQGITHPGEIYSASLLALLLIWNNLNQFKTVANSPKILR